ncbi:hypothetical protein ElyMa_002471800 [Elysia marginata]|uniref:Myb-like domain-containing protein n=1 Tax=Elysia marginata TaxID=1093978 RepID=A0AAV4GPR4_9GAST|nr:hypothetical protein ElyMa_002471800 [Elysia marginata]
MPGSTFVGGSIDIHVRFEALGGNARRAQIFRRHEDLQRAYEHQVKAFARETRHVTSKLSRIQSEHLTRMKAIQSLEPQSFREEWPPVEERRAIIAQMQDGLPLLTGASVAKQASPSSHSKVKDAKPTRQRLKIEKNKLQSSKTNSVSTGLNGMLSKPYFAQPKAHSEPFQTKKREGTKTQNHIFRSDNPQESPRIQKPVRKEQSAPVIVLSKAKDNPPLSQRTPSPQSGVTALAAQPASVLHQPKASSSNLGLSLSGDTIISSNRAARRRWRSRQPWTKEENVLLFKVEGREGKETYTQVAQRKYPSYI